MLLLISFVARYTEISMFLLNSSVSGEEHVNVHLPFANIFSIYSFFDSVFSFWQL